MIVVGDIESQADRVAVYQYAKRSREYTYLDVLSGMRAYHDLQTQCAIPLDGPIDRVIQFGGRITNPRMQKWIKKNAHVHWHVSSDYRRIDPEYSVTKKIVEDISEWCSASTALLHPEPAVRDGGMDLRLFDRKKADVLSEPFVARMLSQYLDEQWALFLSNSMPIRAMDEFAWDLKCLDVGANRGVSGIDGIVSSAIGYSLGCGKKTVLLVGDLAFIHDANGLRFLESHPHPMIIVLINNGGGGIFSHLPIATSEIHEKYFFTPHSHDLSGYSQVFGLSHSKVDTAEGFQKVLASVLAQSRHQVIEVMINQEENLKAYRSYREAIDDLGKCQNLR